jgi:predicted porin
MVQVRQDNLVVVGSYTRSNAPNDIPTLGDAVTMATLGASYRFGIFQPLALVSKVRSRVEPRSVDQTMMNLGLSITLPRSNLRFEVERLRNHALADADGQAISVRYDYHLSKRTTLYVGADKIRSEANVYYPIVGASGSSPVAAPFPASYRGADPASLIAGMLHIF